MAIKTILGLVTTTIVFTAQVQAKTEVEWCRDGWSFGAKSEPDSPRF